MCNYDSDILFIMDKNTTMKTLPNTITNLDIIKTFAVICMIIDHIGYYFLPDFDWLRAIGRLGGMPIWFFLIGYASSRQIPNRWIIGAMILAVLEFGLFGNAFPLNVIITIIGIRLCIDYIMAFVLRTRYLFWLSLIILTLFYIPTNWVTEYGTLAILSAIVGYMVKHKDRLVRETFLTKYDYMGSYLFMVCAITILQISVFSFNGMQSLFLLLATGFVTYILVTMKPTTYPDIKDKTVNAVLQFCGRRTLDIYVAHLVVFKITFWVLYLMGFYQ